LARIQPLLWEAEITRCADITGLDRVGIPVTLAVRPNARLIVGATGKGSTLVHATVSGLMEALEVHHAEYAEHADLGVVMTSYADLASSGVDIVSPGQLPVARYGTFDASWTMAWAWGFDLVRQAEAPIPYLYVHMARDYVPNQVARLPFTQFIAGSNGLASGNTLLEAIAAGLYEVIERDGIALWDQAARQGAMALAVDLDRVDSPTVGELVERCRSAGLQVHVMDITTDVGVPTYSAVLVDASGQGFNQPAGGFGAHHDPEVAMIRAITEAAQSRVVIIAGSRDDVFNADRTRRGPRLLVPEGPPASTRPSLATDTFEGDLRVLFGLLEAQGLDRVIVADLRRKPFDLDVVKVWVPGLEEYCLVSQYQPGVRAHAWQDHITWMPTAA
jgi:YcaO-like protein with predicted kinase domain